MILYFTFRDCLFTAALFEELFKLNVPAIADLACKLPNYAFDPNVHPFRRSKAVEFLIIFWKNNRILQEMNEEFCDQLRKMSKRLYKGCLKVSCVKHIYDRFNSLGYPFAQVLYCCMESLYY